MLYKCLIHCFFIINQMEEQSKAEERDQSEWRKQMEERMIQCLRKEFFQMSVIYKLYRTLQIGKKKLKIVSKDKNVFHFQPTDFRETFGPGPKYLPDFKKQGFKLKVKRKLGKITIYTVSHQEINSQFSQEQARKIWLQRMRRDFQNNKSVYRRFFNQLKKNAKWNQEKNVWLIKVDNYQQFERLHFYGFKIQNKQQISHRYLQQESPIQVWMFVRLFYRIRNKQKLKLERQRDADPQKKKSKNQQQQQEKNKQHTSITNQQDRTRFLVTLEEFLQPQKFKENEGKIAIGIKTKDQETENKKNFPPLATNRQLRKRTHKTYKQQSIEQKKPAEKKRNIKKRNISRQQQQDLNKRKFSYFINRIKDFTQELEVTFQKQQKNKDSSVMAVDQKLNPHNPQHDKKPAER